MSAARKAIPAAIYARISEDSSGLAAGVKRQLEDCRVLAERLGFDPVTEYVDNSRSAMSGPRPAFEQMLDDVAAGKIRAVVVWGTDRLYRRMTDLERLVSALGGIPVHSVMSGDVDLSNADGKLRARLMGSVAQHESEKKGERVARAAEQRARDGRPSGDLGYGWRRIDGDTYELHPDEAQVVREVVERLTAGETLDGLCRDLNARGIPSPGAGHRRRYRSPENPDGTLWVPSGLRKTALRPSNAALRVHRGEIVGAAVWPAIITEAQHRRVVEVLTDPRRRSNGGTAVRRHLLSFGIGLCGVCGSRLRVSPKGGHPLYVCDAPSGCVGRRQERVDEFVEAVVVERLKRPDAADLFTAPQVVGVDPDSIERLARLRERLDDAAARYADGKIDGDQLEVITRKLRPQIDEAERQARPVTATPIPDAARRLAGKRDARAVWDRLDVLTKRAVLEALGVTVTINKTRQGPGFDPESVVIGWA
jgi:DNA invertase Pin-like site-specific DNA recombinase